MADREPEFWGTRLLKLDFFALLQPEESANLPHEICILIVKQKVSSDVWADGWMPGSVSLITLVIYV